MNQVPTPDPAQLRARNPQVFDRPASARLAAPAMVRLTVGVFVFGLVDLDFSPTRFVLGLRELGWITLM